jgi:hypothetical protein
MNNHPGLDGVTQVPSTPAPAVIENSIINPRAVITHFRIVIPSGECAKTHQSGMPTRSSGIFIRTDPLEEFHSSFSYG